MALKQDERALVQLVTERGQSYEDLAGLLGISEAEVRAKARAALTELGGADPDADVGLTDYLLGQADPIGRADAVRYLQQDEEARELATTISTKILAIAPGAQLPTIPEPKGRRRSAASSPASPAAPASTSAGATGTPSASLPTSQNRLLVGLAAGGLILLVAILAIAGVFGGGDDEPSTSSDTPVAETDAGSGDPATLTPEAIADLSDAELSELTGIPEEQVATLSDEEIIAAAQQRERIPVDLEAVGGSGVGGRAIFGLANAQLFLDLDVSGLDPDPGKGESYLVWMMLTENGGFPVAQVVPNENGQIRERYALPTPVTAAIGGLAQSVRLSQTPRGELNQQIENSQTAEDPIVPFTGTNLAAGDIPLAQRAGQQSGGGGNAGDGG